MPFFSPNFSSVPDDSDDEPRETPCAPLSPSALFNTVSIHGLTIVTLNCGSGGLRRCLQEFSPTARHSLQTADIVCLQECRLSAIIPFHNTDVLRAFLGESHAAAHAAAHAALLTRDTGIVVRNPSISVEESAHGARWSFARVRLPPVTSTHTPGSQALSPSAPRPSFSIFIFSIHGPRQAHDWRPIAAALRLHHPDPSSPCVIGADWNSIPDPIIDSLRGTPCNVAWATPGAAIAHLNLVDAFRLLHPVDPGWTYFHIVRSPTGPRLENARRLDGIMFSSFLTPDLSTASTVHTSSDHRAVLVRFGPPLAAPTRPEVSRDPTRRNLTWALHPGIWLSAPFVSAVHHFADHYQPTHALPSPSPLQLWQILSLTTRDHLSRLSRIHGTSPRAAMDHLADLALALENLDCRKPADMARLPGMLTAYRSALAALDACLSLPLNSRLAAAEIRSSSWLSRASTSPRSTPLPSLIMDERMASTPAEKLHMVHLFFSRLYTPPPLPLTFEGDSALILHHLRLRLSPDRHRALDKAFTSTEVLNALRSANRRASPGPDGLPYRVWLELATIAAPALANLANSLATGLPYHVQARTILLSKPGDSSNLSNYRPISITDASVRTLARLVSGRLLDAGDELFPWTQAAFLQGRHTSLISLVLQGLIDQSNAAISVRPSAFVVLSLDQSKAYDRVRHEWLFNCLYAANLPPRLRLLLTSLYSSPSTRIHLAEGLTDEIAFQSGVLQGDPSSCILYNLSLQPFLDLLHDTGVGIQVPHLGILSSLAFADDILIFLDASDRGLEQWHRFQMALTLYERASNARINVTKSCFWMVGDPLPEEEANVQRLVNALTASGFQCHTGSQHIFHLGHPISLTLQPPLAALTARFAAIRARDLAFPTFGISLLARVQKAKQFLTAKLWHAASIGGLPPNFAALYFDALRPYLFSPARPYVTPVDLTRPRALGGFGLIDPDHMATALSISFLRRYLCDPGPSGAWLRASLVAELRHHSKSPPALLLVRQGPAFTALRHPSTRSRGVFGRLLHALASVDLGISDDWKDLPVSALYTLPWTLTYHPPLPTAQKKLRYLRTGWMTWADISWASARGDTTSGAAAPGKYGFPSVDGTKGHRLPYSDSVRGPVPSLDWDSMVSSLPPQTALKILTDLTGRGMASSSAAVGTWCPTPQDGAYEHFPWHLLTVSGRPLLQTTPATTRAALAQKEPRQPNWSISAPDAPAFWRKVWIELEACPLPADLRSSCIVLLGRNIWTYRAPGALCPAGCELPDSPTHGICTCPEALRVWAACLPLLRAMGVSADLEFSCDDIIGAWPHIRSLRPRLVLWRNVVLAVLHAARVEAGRAARANGSTPDFRHCDRLDVLSQACTAAMTSLSAQWSRLAPAPANSRELFTARWVTGSRWLRVENGELRTSAVNAPEFVPPLTPPRPEGPP